MTQIDKNRDLKLIKGPKMDPKWTEYGTESKPEVTRNRS